MEILPAIDIRGGKCVRLRQGDYGQETVFGDDPTEMARRWADGGAQRLHLVDLDGAKAGQPVNHEVVRKIVEAVSVPCQMGGGIRDEASIKLMLDDVGIDRVIVGTQALKDPQWFKEMATRYPGRLALGLDARDSKVATEGWLDVSETSAIDLAKANFSNTRGLREELDEARNALRERKIIEKAKGIIMRERALDEDAAYTLLRNRAMQRGMRLVAVAEMVVEAAEVMQL